MGTGIFLSSNAIELFTTLVTDKYLQISVGTGIFLSSNAIELFTTLVTDKYLQKTH